MPKCSQKMCSFLSFSSVQFSCSVMSYFLPPHGLQQSRVPVHQQLPELTQTHVHWVGEAIQPSHPLLSHSLPAFNLSQHQGLFQWVSSLHQVDKLLELLTSGSVLPMNIQNWFSLGWTGLIFLQSKGLSIVFSNNTVQKHQFLAFSFLFVQLSHPHMTTGKTIALSRWTFVGKVVSLLFNMLSRLVITFLPRSKLFFNFMAAVTICSDFGAQEN